MCKISIITPFYDGNRYLNKLHEMVRNNTNTLKSRYPEWLVEFIVVNDSPGICVEPVTADASYEYRVVEYAKNKGIHGARREGLLHASGSYIVFLDQDDEIADDFLLKQLAAIKDHDIVVSNAYLEQKDGSTLLLYQNDFQFQKITKLPVYSKSHNQIVSPGQCLIKKEAIPQEWLEYTTKRNGSDDLLLWVLMLSRGKRFAINKEGLYTHKYTGSNLSGQEEKMIDSSLEITEYLSKVEYVAKKTIDDIQKSRNFKARWLNSGGGAKMVLLIQNLDILIPRACWKIRSML